MNPYLPWESMNSKPLESPKLIEHGRGVDSLDGSRCVPRNCVTKTPLPIEFRPGPYSVVIGRGKLNTEAIGNRRLRVLALTVLPQYKQCTNKIDKTAVVTRLVDMVREACPTGAFVKQINGRWWECDGHACREKVGYVLRDLLHERYRSSSKAKVARRRVERLRKRGRLIVEDSTNDDSETATEAALSKPSNTCCSPHPVSQEESQWQLPTLGSPLPMTTINKVTIERPAKDCLASFLTVDNTFGTWQQLQPPLPQKHLLIDTQPDQEGEFPDDISEVFTTPQYAL